MFSTGLYASNGLDSTITDLGYYIATLKETDKGKFHIPSLRNIELTAPYMHDGRFSTLEEVVDHYDHGVVRSPNLDPNMKAVDTGLRFTAQDKSDMVAFLKTLTDTSFIANPSFK